MTQRLAPPPPPQPPRSVSYLFWNPAHGIGMWDFMSPLDSVYQVNPRGWGDVHKPPPGFPGGEVVPYLPGHEWQGIRVNMELFDPDNASWPALGFSNNLPTFLIVQGPGSDVPALELGGEQQSGSSGSGPRRSMLPSDTQRLEHDSAAHRRAQEAFRKLQGSK
ncbi:MAG: hypothetical protein IT458_20235 [Planctomycetes bacterium]|nr:hypothetical protein [Planctomycetota bacterium]